MIRLLVPFALAVSSLGAAQPQPQTRPAIVFVCEHGAAKSVIATAYFNTLAAERGLPYRATFRGTAPQEALSARTVEGLRADNITLPTGRPTAIASSDIAQATRCVMPS